MLDNTSSAALEQTRLALSVRIGHVSPRAYNFGNVRKGIETAAANLLPAAQEGSEVLHQQHEMHLVDGRWGESELWGIRPSDANKLLNFAIDTVGKLYAVACNTTPYLKISNRSSCASADMSYSDSISEADHEAKPLCGLRYRPVIVNGRLGESEKGVCLGVNCLHHHRPNRL